MKKTLRWLVAQKLEALWWKLYLSTKNVDSYLASKKKYWDNFLSRLLPEFELHPGQAILDAGCGPAGIFIDLPGYDVTACDPLLDVYEAKLPHFKKAMYPGVSFITSPLETFTTDKTFDAVFCINAINHVSVISQAFETLYKCTKKGGYTIVSIDAHNHKFLKRIFRTQAGDILHPHQYDLEEYTQMLTQLGCEVVKTVLFKKGFIFDYYALVAIKK